MTKYTPSSQMRTTGDGNTETAVLRGASLNPSSWSLLSGWAGTPDAVGAGPGQADTGPFSDRISVRMLSSVVLALWVDRSALMNR